MIQFDCPVAAPQPGLYLFTANGCQDYIWTTSDNQELTGNDVSILFDAPGEHIVEVACAEDPENKIACKILILNPEPLDSLITCEGSEWGEACMCNGTGDRWPNNIVTYGFSPEFSQVERDLFAKAVEELQSNVKCLKLLEVEYTQADIPVIYDQPQPGEDWLAVAYDLGSHSLIAFNELVNFGPGLFADTALHELIHALRVFDHASTPDNIMFASAVSSFYDPLTDSWAQLGSWDTDELEVRYCEPEQPNFTRAMRTLSDLKHTCPGVIKQSMPNPLDGNKLI